MNEILTKLRRTRSTRQIPAITTTSPSIRGYSQRSTNGEVIQQRPIYILTSLASVKERPGQAIPARVPGRPGITGQGRGRALFDIVVCAMRRDKRSEGFLLSREH